MNYDQTLKKDYSHMDATRLPGFNSYNSVRSLQHPTQMRVTGRYGQTSIPANSFFNRPNQQQAASYLLGRSLSQPQNAANQVRQSGLQQTHYPLPQYNYGIRQEQVCAPYRLPVYYEEPMQVRQQWEKPVDSYVKQQNWRFVKTEDKGGIVKYVNKDEVFVPTHQSQWDKHYEPKKVAAPVIPPTRQVKTCCTPMLFGLLGLLALLGLILGLVLLLNCHKAQVSTPTLSASKADVIQPTKGKVVQEIPAIKFIVQPQNKPATVPVTRPTFSQPITTQASEKISTAEPIQAASQTKLDQISAVDIKYGYQQNSYSGVSSVNYNNDYQTRQPITQPQAAINASVAPSVVQPIYVVANSYNSVIPESDPASLRSEELKPLAPTSTPITSVSTAASILQNKPNPIPYSSNSTNSNMGTGNNDFRVPIGYGIDQNGMVVKI